MAFIAPEKYHFYVGVSQLVNYHKNINESYRLVKSIATKKADENALNVLNSISSPPWDSPRSFGKLRKIIRRYENEVVGEQPTFTLLSNNTSH